MEVDQVGATDLFDLGNAVQDSSDFDVVVDFEVLADGSRAFIVFHGVPFVGVLTIAQVELAIVSPEIPPALFFENKGGHVGKKRKPCVEGLISTHDSHFELIDSGVRVTEGS